jgi:hypothetical protein
MNEDILREAFHEMFSSLEALETQNAAILSLLKEKGIATDEALAPHFEQAANASNVRWRAAQVRMDYLLSSATKVAEQAAEKQAAKPEASHESPPSIAPKSSRSEVTENAAQSTNEGETEEEAQSTEPPSPGGPHANEAPATPEKSGSQKREKDNQPNQSPKENAA